MRRLETKAWMQILTWKTCDATLVQGLSDSTATLQQILLLISAMW